MNKRNVEVEVRTGKHPTVKFPIKAVEDMLKNYLQQRGFYGKFQATFGRARHGKGNRKTLRVIENKKTCVLLIVSPDRSGISFEIHLIVPGIFSKNSEEFFQMLLPKKKR